MGRLNIQNDLFLGLQELQRANKFVKEDGYIRLFKSMINSFGIVKVDSDTSFDNFKVTNGSANGTIQIAQDSYAIDKNIDIIFQEALNDIAVPSDSAWYWVKISYEESSIEQGQVSVSSDGDLTGTDTEFSKVLRDQSNYPVKINFPGSIINTGDYQVISVLSDTSAIIAGDLTDENNLDYKVIGSFTPGISPSGSDRFPYFYDNCSITLVEETVTDTPPAKTSGTEFYIARVRNTGAVLADIQDKRTEFFTAAGENGGWIEPSLNANFTQVAGREIEYRKNYIGEVEIRGGFTTTLTTGTIFTLPDGYRPANTDAGVYTTYDFDKLKTMIVDSDGNVSSGATTGNDYDTSNENIIVNMKFKTS